MLGYIAKLFGGNKSERDTKELLPLVDKINQYFSEYQSLSNDDLRHKTTEFKERVRAYLGEIDAEITSLNQRAEDLPAEDIHGKDDLYGEVDKLRKTRDEKIEAVLKEVLPEAFAVVKEAARRFAAGSPLRLRPPSLTGNSALKRTISSLEGDKVIYNNSWNAAGSPITWNMVHYDVQLIGGMVLHSGKIAEMATGEGKTLVSTLPAYLNALAGEGVHIVTVNDYLARRDSEWNGPLFEFLGITVDCIDKHSPIHLNAERLTWRILSMGPTTNSASTTSATTWSSPRTRWCSANTTSPWSTRWTAY